MRKEEEEEEEEEKEKVYANEIGGLRERRAGGGGGRARGGGGGGKWRLTWWWLLNAFGLRGRWMQRRVAAGSCDHAEKKRVTSGEFTTHKSDPISFGIQRNINK